MVTKMKQNMAQNLLRNIKNYLKIPDWTKNKQNVAMCNIFSSGFITSIDKLK